MDYSTIAPWKAEEKDLSEKLYKKLQGLFLLHPPTEDFRKCCNDEMFLKPNPQAFFHVIHYLFKLYDPVEFRKRFYWPVVDKKAEANFRTSTIEYLKYLNEKHQLRWNNIKSYLVVMPGGMKFINFLLDLVGFIVHEQIKQREKYLSINNAEFSVSGANIKQMQMKNQFLKEYSSEFIKEASNHTAKLQEKTKLIKSTLNQFSTSIKFDLIGALRSNDQFLEAFVIDNNELFEVNFNKPINNVYIVQKMLVNLKETMDIFQCKESELKIDKDAVRRSMLHIKKLFSPEILIDDKENEFHAIPYNTSIRLKDLVSAFNCIFSVIEEQLMTADQMPQCSDFILKELERLNTELQHVELQITDFLKKINAQMKDSTVEKNQGMKTPLLKVSRSLTSLNKENALLSKIVSTPPIRLEMHNSNLKRLPFLDDCAFNTERSMIASAKAGMENFNVLLALPRSQRKQKTPEKTMILNDTLQKSKIINPKELLRSIQKDTSKAKIFPKANQSILGSKWKERQVLFGNDIALPTSTLKINATSPFTNGEFSTHSSYFENEQANVETIYNETLTSISPFTPLNSNDLTRIARHQVLETSANGNDAANNLLFHKKLSAVKKVQDASLNFHNLSTSPSGRLDPLVSMEANNILLPKILVNDVSLSSNHENKNQQCEGQANNSLSLQNDIFNITDGVLQDITM